MKKLCTSMLIFAFLGLPAFGDTGEQEIDFLLFLPNSSNRFVNEEQEMVHLDNLARYLLSRNIAPGQIHVHGYTAAAKNDVEPVELSRDRAFFVINELERRGVPSILFSEPVAHGEVDLWGSNITEGERNPNRRVRIMLDGSYLAAAGFTAAEETAVQRALFPWRLLLLPLLALLAALLFFALKPKKGTTTAAAASEISVSLEEEIRRRAYELYLAREGQNGDADTDWYKAVPEICARYEASVYEVYTEDGYWWAHR